MTASPSHRGVSIRWKLLLLMLGIAVAPLFLIAWLDLDAMTALGARLAAQTGAALGDQTRASLERQADNFARLMSRERQLVELLVRLQVREVERALAAPPPAHRTMFGDAEFDAGNPELALESRPQKYFRLNGPDDQTPIPISFREQAVHLAPGTEARAVRDDAARLGTLTPFLAEAHRHHDDLVFWQFTALASGLHASYPGHGGYPENFDPRLRNWYQEQERMHTFRWSPPQIDVNSRLMLAAATMPVFDATGRFAGVTGIDVRLTSLLRTLTLPPHLAAEAQVLLAVNDADATGERARLALIARHSQRETGGDWRELPDVEHLQLDDDAAQARLLADVALGRDGTLRTAWRGADSFCVYRRFGDARTFLLLIVPTRAATGPAMAAAEYALAVTKRQSDTLGSIVLAVALLIVGLAFLASRAVTGPLDRLVAAVGELARGRFDTRVDIRTGDELQRLGDSFNAMTAQLAEHTRVKESLALAREVQQQLLPRQAPSDPRLDIAGLSVYCDQTGGDYFDYLDRRREDRAELGIVLGDVSGHGVAAALLMTTARALLHGAASTLESPAAILDEVNARLAADVRAGQFMTLFYLLCDLDRRVLRWTSAGHDGAWRFRPITDEFLELSGPDIPLGIDAAWRYREADPVTFERDDIIVLGTDGIWDARATGGERFGKNRLREVIRRDTSGSATRLAGNIVAAVERFREGAPPTDDVTIVVIRITE
ncbi:MAG: SpoIIE family protein phosphatase [Gammaproteobacteria bacterium]|nr:SpoIIE family protein phosphatase [Gammaproteobacteria bacterium]